MMDKKFYPPVDRNKLVLGGVLVDDLQQKHEYQSCKIYEATIKVERLSGVSDYLTINISSQVDGVSDLKKGSKVLLVGSIRTRQSKDEYGIKRTNVYMFVKDILPFDDFQNITEIEGRLYKDPILRKAKTNKTEDISELIIEVHRGYDKYEHIPVIVWDRLDKLYKGDRVFIKGRFQSRNITRHKRGTDNEYESGVVYEVIGKEVFKE